MVMVLFSTLGICMLLYVSFTLLFVSTSNTSADQDNNQLDAPVKCNAASMELMWILHVLLKQDDCSMNGPLPKWSFIGSA